MDKATFTLDYQATGMQEKNEDKEVVYSALKESEQRLKSIIETAVDGIINIDMRGIIEFINPSALKLFQYTAQEVVGKNVSVLMPEPDQSRHSGYLDNYHKTGKAKIIGVGRQVLGMKKDGSTFPFRLSISEVHLESGKLYTGIIHDLTEEVKAQHALLELNDSLEERVQERTEQLNEAMQSLELTNKSLSKEVAKRERKEQEVRLLLDKEIELGELKSRFVSMASHEFRTPLTGIQSAASLIDRYDDAHQSADRARLTGMIRTSVRNLTNILNDFLSMDKLHSGKVSINRSQFEFEELLEEVIDEIAPTISGGQSITKELNNLESAISADRNILKNVLLNLVSNAIKYSKEGGVVTIQGESSNGRLSVVVIDNGIGIPLVDQKHMYERFFRAHNVTNIKGTGLGLNIVKRYLDLLEGDISFESTEGVGTRFTISVPV